MRSLPERGAPSHRQCPPICPPQALLQLVQEKSFGEERGAIPPKRGPYSLPFSGAGVGNSLSRRGGVPPSPIAPPSLTDTRGRGGRRLSWARAVPHSAACPYRYAGPQGNSPGAALHAADGRSPIPAPNHRGEAAGDGPFTSFQFALRGAIREEKQETERGNDGK